MSAAPSPFVEHIDVRLGTLSLVPSSLLELDRATVALVPTLSSSRNPAGSLHMKTMASPVETAEVRLCHCPDCGKEFQRPCDLNKHKKSHTRPFKCQVPACKYQDRGWPTLKELERHMNDKHSVAPQTFPCLFRGCAHWSKRESNCKQHMEKAHGWNYVRSKSNGRRRSSHQQADIDLPPPSNPAISPITPSPNTGSSKSSFLPQYHGDFDPFPSDHTQSTVAAIGNEQEENEAMRLDDLRSQDSETVIPWASPGTRLWKVETVLQRYQQNFEGRHLIDPRISWDVSSLEPPSSSNYVGTSNNYVGAKLAQSRDSAGIIGWSDSRPVCTSTLKGGRGVSPPRLSVSDVVNMSVHQRPGGPTTTSQDGTTLASGSKLSGTALPGCLRPAFRSSSSSKRKGKESEDSEDEDHSRKKIKPSVKPGFKDKEMPCIFHHAYPDVYNSQTGNRYISCLTKHKEISTLVRHLGRTHHLHVERYLSSFNTGPRELAHVHAGSCRRCWESHTDHEEFNRHISSVCEKVSKGKREKWQVLHDAFTPLLNDGCVQVASHPPGTLSPVESTSAPVSAPQEESPDSAPSPVTVATTAELQRPMSMPDDGISDNHGLLNRLQELEQINGNQEQIIGNQKQIIGTQRQIILQVAPHLLQEPAFRSIPGDHALAAPYTLFGPIGAPDAKGHLPTDDIPDRESLVGHMDSQPTDVDHKGMMDDIKTLSRTSSSVSDQSTILHAPPPDSPPQGREQFKFDNCPSGKVQQKDSPTDSAYGTGPKGRSSLGDPHVVEQIYAAPLPRAELTPRSMPEPPRIPAVPTQPLPLPQYHMASDGPSGFISDHNSANPWPPGPDQFTGNDETLSQIYEGAPTTNFFEEQADLLNSPDSDIANRDFPFLPEEDYGPY